MRMAHYLLCLTFALRFPLWGPAGSLLLVAAPVVVTPPSLHSRLAQVLYDQPTGRLALVFELMDMNIYELIRGRRHYVAEDRVKVGFWGLFN
jgi:hypothetical protein